MCHLPEFFIWETAVIMYAFVQDLCEIDSQTDYVIRLFLSFSLCLCLSISLDICVFFFLVLAFYKRKSIPRLLTPHSSFLFTSTASIATSKIRSRRTEAIQYRPNPRTSVNLNKWFPNKCDVL